MKQEQVIELAKKAGFPFNKYGLLQGDEEGEIDADEMFTRFASLVEQATLERAADVAKQEFDMRNAAYIDKERDAQERALAGVQAAANIHQAIRNLEKDTQ